MRLHTDEEIESFDEITLIDMLKKENLFRRKKYFIGKIGSTDLLKKYESIRYLMFWHDLVLNYY